MGRRIAAGLLGMMGLCCGTTGPPAAAHAGVAGPPLTSGGMANGHAGADAAVAAIGNLLGGLPEEELASFWESLRGAVEPGGSLNGSTSQRRALQDSTITNHGQSFNGGTCLGKPPPQSGFSAAPLKIEYRTGDALSLLISHMAKVRPRPARCHSDRGQQRAARLEGMAGMPPRRPCCAAVGGDDALADCLITSVGERPD